MNDRSSSRAKIKDIGPEKRDAIVKLRRERVVMRCIAATVGVSVATVARVCRKAGLSRLSKIDPPPAVQRYERATAGELLHIDIKKLGRIGCVGHRITGDPSVRARNVGWEFVHVAIDDFSRVSYAEILDNERAVTSKGFLSRAIEWFAKQGVRIDRIMTDNGVGYVSNEYAAMCRALQTASAMGGGDRTIDRELPRDQRIEPQPSPRNLRPERQPLLRLRDSGVRDGGAGQVELREA